ncbi:thiamine phosphate synthase [Methylomarinum sp. Ch1-1]|uniref:Thiamine-phosphate synthase n=1 Tax=Methylomarinum roseum TaxID=3067653 RepID=A0AAU7NQP2_9GAMM|nr:thiamine phosphate synthase [Methylomarinum sp. Ch1-1]MDP4521061.1 thiamine phosphate synthase [Methylomarinum sp. Ch1-1]
MKFPSKGLYAITQTEAKSADAIIAEVRAALQGGAVVIQYRDKTTREAQPLASALLQECHRHHAPLIINDDIELAAKIGADGVHLGRDDGSVAAARQLLGPKAIIGVSCYDDLAKAIDMQGQGVDYVAFGRFFPSNSKPLASPAHITTLQQARQSINIPIVAIGGILPDNGAQLLAAGADLLAVIGGVFEHDPEQSARAYQRLFI